MKKFWKCKVTILLIAGWIVLSIVGYLGKDTVYKNYTLDVKKTPYFVLVFEGIHDGVYPWSGDSISLWERWELMAERHREEREAERLAESVLDTEVSGTEAVIIEGEIPATEELPPQPKEFVQVDESYFSDAVFIGDSRTVGLQDYGGLDEATFYATVGMNVYNLWEEAFCEVDGELVTLEEALTTQQFGKIYFQIGINEMGRGTVDGFMEAYTQTVEKFRELQPDAVVFVQGIMKVTKTKSEEDKIFNNGGIQERNDRIAQMEDKISVFYLDMNEVVCDEEGNLDESLTFDDVHLFGSKYGSWVRFLESHGIE